MLGLDTPAFGRQSRAVRHGLVQAPAPFLLGEMIGQFFPHLTKDSNDVAGRSVFIRPVGPADSMMCLMKHSVQSPMLCNQMVHIAAAFIISTHDLSSFLGRS